MKIFVASALIVSAAILTGCVDDRPYYGGPEFRSPPPRVDNRWRDDRGGYDRGRYDRYDRRDRGDWRDGRRDDRPVRYDQFGRPIIYYR